MGKYENKVYKVSYRNRSSLRYPMLMGPIRAGIRKRTFKDWYKKKQFWESYRKRGALKYTIGKKASNVS